MTKQKQVLHKYSDPLVSTLLKHIWQRLQSQVFLGMTIQAWHTCIWRLSPILLCWSSQALSGWMGSIAAQLFSDLSRNDRSGSSPGSDRATQGHSETCHSCVVLAVFSGSLSCWKVNLRPSLRFWAGVHQGSLYFAPFIFPSILSSLPVPAAEKHINSRMLSPPCLIWYHPYGVLQTWRLVFRTKSSILVSSDQIILFLMVRVFRCLLANSKQAVMCLLLRSGFHLATWP